MSIYGINTQLFKAFDAIKGEREDSFTTSLPYYLLTGRKGCKLYSDGTANVVVANHPHLDNTALVFPELDGDFTLTAKLLNNLALQKQKVQLARYTDDDYAQLTKALEVHKSSVIASIKIKPEDIMDWKYPAHILGVKKVASMQSDQPSENKAFSTLRNKFGKSAHEFEEIPLTHPEAIQQMRASIMIWAGLRISVGQETGHDMQGFYQAISELITALPDKLDGFVVRHKGEPAGFSIWDQAGKTANSLASLSRRSINGMSEYVMVRTCQKLDARGAERLNLGGSETTGLDQFKLKFMPIESVTLNSYDVDYASLDTMGIKEESIVKQPNP